MLYAPDSMYREDPGPIMKLQQVLNVASTMVEQNCQSCINTRHTSLRALALVSNTTLFALYNVVVSLLLSHDTKYNQKILMLYYTVYLESTRGCQDPTKTTHFVIYIFYSSNFVCTFSHVSPPGTTNGQIFLHYLLLDVCSKCMYAHDCRHVDHSSSI